MNIILWPVSRASGLLGLLYISLLTALLMLWIFKRVSNQAGIQDVKNKIKAHLLGLRLYQNEPVLSLITIRELFRQNFRYFGFAFRPMLIMMLPVMIIVIQLASRYDRQSLPVGESSIVSVFLSESTNPDSVKIRPDDTMILETSSLYTREDHALHARIKTEQPGCSHLSVEYQENRIDLLVYTELDKKMLQGSRYPATDIRTLLTPGSTPLPGHGFIRKVHVQYPSQTLILAGIRWHWLLVFFIVSLVAGYGMKGIFGVEI